MVIFIAFYSFLESQESEKTSILPGFCQILRFLSEKIGLKSKIWLNCRLFKIQKIRFFGIVIRARPKIFQFKAGFRRSRHQKSCLKVEHHCNWYLKWNLLNQGRKLKIFWHIYDHFRKIVFCFLSVSGLKFWTTKGLKMDHTRLRWIDNRQLSPESSKLTSDQAEFCEL